MMTGSGGRRAGAEGLTLDERLAVPCQGLRARGSDKGDSESQRPGGREGLKGTLKPVVTIWTGCLEGQESADQGQAERLSKGMDSPARSGDVTLCQ